MMNNKPNNHKSRVIHRYIGNFLAGIMAVYAISGIVLIFRDTDFLKNEHQIEKKLEANISKKNLAKALRMRGLKDVSENTDTITFSNGSYNKTTGVANITVMKLPIVLEKLTHLHKAKTGDPLYWFNIFFGVALLMLVLTSFLMFRPKTKIFTKGLYFTMAGVALILFMIFWS
jgi:hypothetical protein